METKVSTQRIWRGDIWILTSLFHKAIRRGEHQAAVDAWIHLHGLDRKRAWRRLLLAAFEDVGVSDLRAIVDTSTAYLNRVTESDVAKCLVQRLTAAPKDRSADYLFCGCIRHLSLKALRFRLERASVQELLLMLSNSPSELELRALPAIILLQRNGLRGRLGLTRAALVKAIAKQWTADAAIVEATEHAFKKSNEPFLLMLPLLVGSTRAQGNTTSKQIEVPKTRRVDSLPMYALDKHTRIGRAAIREFAAANDDVRRCLKEYVAPQDNKSAAYMAAYYTDATPISNRFVWTDSDRLEILGTEADMYSAGVPLEGVEPLLKMFRDNLVHLDEIRAQLFRKKFGGGGS